MMIYIIIFRIKLFSYSYRCFTKLILVMYMGVEPKNLVLANSNFDTELFLFLIFISSLKKFNYFIKIKTIQSK